MSTLGNTWLAGAVAFAVVALATPLLTTVWRALGRSDTELSLRKIHDQDIPRVGGLVVMIAVAGTLTWQLVLAEGTIASVPNPVLGAVAGAFIAGLAGLFDDLFGLRARYKLLFQFVGAAVAIALGLQWSPIDFLFDRNWASLVLTASFLVVSANAINLIDGLDGLAGGVVAIGLAVILLATTAHEQVDLTLLLVAAITLGAVLGFLLHNRHPARVFMGDGGAYFLGFLLAGLLISIEPVRPRTIIVRLSIPLMVMALPLLDMVLAVTRRAIRGQPVFSSDADHIHHRLLARGLPQNQVVGILWLIGAMFASMGLLGVLGISGTWTLTGALLSTALVVRMLGYHRLFSPSRGLASEDYQTWRERRRELIDLIDAIEELGRAQDDQGPERWHRLAPDLEMVLERMGIAAYQIREPNGDVVVEGGLQPRQGRAWLDLPFADGASLRLALGGGLAGMLQPEQQILLERILAAVSGTKLIERRSKTPATGGDSPDSAA